MTVMMIGRGQEGNKRVALSCLGIDSSKSMETVTNDICGFVPLITTFAAITVQVIVDPYLLPLIVIVAKGILQSLASSVESTA